MGSLMRFGGNKTSKVLEPDQIEKLVIDKADLPEGAVFKCFRDFYVQDLEIKKKVTKFRRAVYKLPDGKFIVAPLPKELNGKHFGAGLRAYILQQCHLNQVPQPKIHQSLLDYGIQISAGEVNELLMQDTLNLEQEYNEVRVAGIQSSEYVGSDDTGGRHEGKNVFSLMLQSELFAHVKTTASKSRKNFFSVLRGETNTDYVFNNVALEYIKRFKHKKNIETALEERLGRTCANYEELQKFLAEINITAANTGKDTLLHIEEAGMYGSAVEHGFDPNTVLLSDDAPQFIAPLHALCWIHVERSIKKLIAKNKDQQKEIDRILAAIWHFYQRLQKYRKKPKAKLRELLDKRFDDIFQRAVENIELAAALKRIRDKKDQLLMVLTHPFVPLNNNGTESEIRAVRIKQKISGSTRSDDGMRVRDIAISLIKTCRKLGISVWEYFNARIRKSDTVPYLPAAIRERAKASKTTTAPPAPSQVLYA